MSTPITSAPAAPGYTASHLGSAQMLVFRSDNAPLVSAVGKVRSFIGNTTAPQLDLTPAEFSAIRAALAGEDAIVLRL